MRIFKHVKTQSQKLKSWLKTVSIIRDGDIQQYINMLLGKTWANKSTYKIISRIISSVNVPV